VLLVSRSVPAPITSRVANDQKTAP
jgi:hypothetical protein